MVVFVWWVCSNSYDFRIGVVKRNVPHCVHFWCRWVVEQKEEKEGAIATKQEKQKEGWVMAWSSITIVGMSPSLPNLVQA
jgi:hypothetical protein